MVKKTEKDRKNTLLMELAKRIRHYRYSRGLTQEQLAEKAGLHVNYIGGLERSQRNPSYICLIFLSEALEIKPKDLMPE